MKKSYYRITQLLMSLCLLVIIFDSKTAILSTKKAMELCYMTVIPGIFPLLFLSTAIASEVNNIKLPFLEHVLRIPRGSFWLFLIGLLCGYPIGGKLLQDQINNKAMSKQAACRMMLFCNNAGPAFIIGILSSIFSSSAAIIMWLIQIITSVILGIIIPTKETNECYQTNECHKPLTQVMSNSIKAIATICGWVTIFSVLNGYLDQIILNKLDHVLNTIFAGVTELTNGIARTAKIENKSIAFTVCAVLLSFGGCCVILQTKSVTPDLKMKPYLLARMIHAGISGTFASVAGIYLFPNETIPYKTIPLLLLAVFICIIILFFNKKVIAFQRKV